MDRLSSFLSTNQVVIVTGSRRAGKSFIMRQMARRLIHEGLNPKQTLIVNFEDPRYVGLNVSLLDDIYRTYQEMTNLAGKPVIFLDEIQEVERFEKWVRMMHELDKARIVISGSNANLLSREFGTVLTGRHVDLCVMPLSLGEFFAFQGMPFQPGSPAGDIRVRAHLRQYLEFGGFPEVALSGEKKEILFRYYEDVLHKDILRRHKIRKPQEMRALIKHFMSNVGTLMTFKAASRALEVSVNTVKKFSGFLEQAYLIFLLNRFSCKVREQEQSPRKVYAIDAGLCNVVGFRFSERPGRLAENIVFLALKRRQFFDPSIELFYWKDVQHHEVDFVVKKGLDVSELVQVCWDVGDEKTKARETRGLLKAMREFGLEAAVVVTEDAEREEVVDGRRVRFIPLWKWLPAAEGAAAS